MLARLGESKSAQIIEMAVKLESEGTARRAIEVQRLKHNARLALSLGARADCELLRHLESALLHYGGLETGDRGFECLELAKALGKIDADSRDDGESATRDAPPAVAALVQAEERVPSNAGAQQSATPVDDSSSAERIQSLMLQQKDLSVQALEQERRTQAVLSEEVSRLTSVLKEAALHMQHSLQQQNVHLDSLQHVAAENQTELDKQTGKTKEQVKEMTGSVWATVGSVVWMIAMFVATYVVIRLFPKP